MTQSLGKLGDVMPTVKIKQAEATRSFQVVKPVFLEKLIEKAGRSGAAEKLGFSPTGLSQIIEAGEARTCVELAARYIYEKEFEVKSRPDFIFALVKVPSGNVDALAGIVKAINGEIIPLNLQ